jgi:hypothetical protein
MTRFIVAALFSAVSLSQTAHAAPAPTTPVKEKVAAETPDDAPIKEAPKETQTPKTPPPKKKPVTPPPDDNNGGGTKPPTKPRKTPSPDPKPAPGGGGGGGGGLDASLCINCCCTLSQWGIESPPLGGALVGAGVGLLLGGASGAAIGYYGTPLWSDPAPDALRVNNAIIGGVIGGVVLGAVGGVAGFAAGLKLAE